MEFSCPPEFIMLGHRLADAAQPVARSYFRTEGLAIEQKTLHDPVTLADREIEQKWREMILAYRPQDAIWGEEYGRENQDAELTWIFDPIDGTKAFTLGRTTFGCMIGLHHREHGFIMGIVSQPILDWRWFGAVGHGASFNGKSLRSVAPPSFSEVRISVTNPIRMPRELKLLHDELKNDAAYIYYGGDVMNYVGVADGSLHVNFESGQKIYDIAAAIPVIHQAGGIITRTDGTEIGLTLDHDVIAACTPELHADILARYKKIAA